MMLSAVMFKTKVSVTPIFRDIVDIPNILLVIIIIVIYDNVLDLMQDACNTLIFRAFMKNFKIKRTIWF